MRSIWRAATLALPFLALHLPFLPASLEDVDSINFALGLRDFDVAEHQPHPPGYPVFMLLARLFMAATGSEIVALGLSSVFAGTIAVLAMTALFAGLRPLQGWSDLAPAALVCVAPLFWLTAARPLSDMTGLAAALVVQALLLHARRPRDLIWAAVAAGASAGVRSQAVWLTLPLLLYVTLTWSGGSRARLLGSVATGYLAGVVVWLVPLVALSGGPSGYWRALTAQGAEDFANVSMLVTSFTPRLALNALHDTFVAPWAAVWLAVPVLAAAAAGLVVAVFAERRDAAILLAAFGPYLAFHLLLQETFTTRYALPLVVPIGWLAVRGARLAGRRAGAVLAVLLIAGSMLVAHPALTAYASEHAPAFRLLADMRRARQEEPSPVLAMHRRGAFDFRRPLIWQGDQLPRFAGRLDSPPKHEWLELVRYWNSGGRAPVWFIADPFRSDLALIHHEGPTASYRWSFPSALVGGARPDTMDWYVFERPSWYLGEGWSITPETAGVAGEDRRGPGIAPIEGWIRRTDAPLRLMIGGRNLDPTGPPLDVVVKVDDRVVDQWTAPPGFFLRWIDLRPAAGHADYMRLTVGGTLPALAIEQFDAQPAGTTMFGFAEGWHELEFNPVTGSLWRWTSDRSIIQVRSAGNALVLDLQGEADPWSDGPALRVSAGGQVLLDTRVEGRFSLAVPVPGVALHEIGAVTIETDRVHVPAERVRGSTDRRRLGLRVFNASIRPAS